MWIERTFQSTWGFSAVRPAAAARGWCQVARHMNDPNGIIDASSASPLAPESVAAMGWLRSVRSILLTKATPYRWRRSPELGFFAIALQTNAHNAVQYFGRCEEARGQPQRDWGRTSGTMCWCAERERGTHAHGASKLRPVDEREWPQEGHWESQSKTLPQSAFRMHSTCIPHAFHMHSTCIPHSTCRVRKTDTLIVFYLFVLYSFTCLKTCHFTPCFHVTMNVYFCCYFRYCTWRRHGCAYVC